MSFFSRMLKRTAEPSDGYAGAPTAHQPCALDSDSVVSRIDVLRRYGTSFSTGLLNDKSVLLITESLRRFGDLTGWVRAQGSDVVRIGVEDLGAMTRSQPSRWGMVVVDADITSDLNELLDRLADLRDAHPDLPVILTSHYFGRDDMSLSRLTVCDASLRMPLQMARLEFAFAMALENNLIWQERSRNH
jgi:hypothetical protein